MRTNALVMLVGLSLLSMFLIVSCSQKELHLVEARQKGTSTASDGPFCWQSFADWPNTFLEKNNRLTQFALPYGTQLQERPLWIREELGYKFTSVPVCWSIVESGPPPSEERRVYVIGEGANGTETVFAREANNGTSGIDWEWGIDSRVGHPNYSSPALSKQLKISCSGCLEDPQLPIWIYSITSEGDLSILEDGPSDTPTPRGTVLLGPDCDKVCGSPRFVAEETVGTDIRSRVAFVTYGNDGTDTPGSFCVVGFSAGCGDCKIMGVPNIKAGLETESRTWGIEFRSDLEEEDAGMQGILPFDTGRSSSTPALTTVLDHGTAELNSSNSDGFAWVVINEGAGDEAVLACFSCTYRQIGNSYPKQVMGVSATFDYYPYTGDYSEQRPLGSPVVDVEGTIWVSTPDAILAFDSTQIGLDRVIDPDPDSSNEVAATSADWRIDSMPVCLGSSATNHLVFVENRITGSPQWHIRMTTPSGSNAWVSDPVPGKCFSQPVVDIAGSSINIVVNSEERLYRFDTGQTDWVYRSRVFGCHQRSSPSLPMGAVSGSERRVYVGSDAGGLLCFSSDQSAIPSRPWTNKYLVSQANVHAMAGHLALGFDAEGRVMGAYSTSGSQGPREVNIFREVDLCESPYFEYALVGESDPTDTDYTDFSIARMVTDPNGPTEQDGVLYQAVVYPNPNLSEVRFAPFGTSYVGLGGSVYSGGTNTCSVRGWNDADTAVPAVLRSDNNLRHRHFGYYSPMAQNWTDTNLETAPNWNWGPYFPVIPYLTPYENNYRAVLAHFINQWPTMKWTSQLRYGKVTYPSPALTETPVGHIGTAVGGSQSFLSTAFLPVASGVDPVATPWVFMSAKEPSNQVAKIGVSIADANFNSFGVATVLETASNTSYNSHGAAGDAVYTTGRSAPIVALVYVSANSVSGDNKNVSVKYASMSSPTTWAIQTVETTAAGQDVAIAYNEEEDRIYVLYTTDTLPQKVWLAHEPL